MSAGNTATTVTVTGTLPVGVVVDGIVHQQFTLRAATVRDNIKAIDQVGGDNAVALGAAMYCEQLTALGSLTKKQITYELICDLAPEDYNALEAASVEVAKKRRGQAEKFATGLHAGSPSSALPA